MKKIGSIIRLASFGTLLASSALFADQLAWNKQDISERGARAIKPNSFLVSYCSLADHEYVEVWLVKKVVVTAAETKGLYEISVLGTRLFRSVKRFDEGEYAEPVQYQALPPDKQTSWFQEGIDLAYVYVPSDGKSFRCLGKVLELECDVRVDTITLPDDVMTKAMKERDANQSIE